MQAYIDRLAAGLDSYPECRAKASLYRSMLASRPVDPEPLPAPLRDLVERPRPVSDWIAEVHSHALMLALFDQHFDDRESFRQFCYQEQSKLWSSKLYAFMMRFVSPQRLIASASARWEHFHRGTTLRATPGAAPHSAEMVLEGPAHVYDEITLLGLTEGVRALLDRSAIDSTLTLVEWSATQARWVVHWKP